MRAPDNGAPRRGRRSRLGRSVRGHRATFDPHRSRRRARSRRAARTAGPVGGDETVSDRPLGCLGRTTSSSVIGRPSFASRWAPVKTVSTEIGEGDSSQPRQQCRRIVVIAQQVAAACTGLRGRKPHGRCRSFPARPGDAEPTTRIGTRGLDVGCCPGASSCLRATSSGRQWALRCRPQPHRRRDPSHRADEPPARAPQLHRADRAATRCAARPAAGSDAACGERCACRERRLLIALVLAR